MDIPAAPWLALGVVLGVALVVLAGLVTALHLRRRSSGAVAVATPEATVDQDDLPGFLESPPGSLPAEPPAGWAPLAAAPGAPVRTEGPPPVVRSRRDRIVVLGAMAATALLLLGATAGVAAVSGSGGRHRTPSVAAPPSAAGTAARLTFGGVVLEPRAVGVTATYPVVELSSDGDRPRAHVEFPTYNCLAGDAPADPVAAGCIASVTEYADLAAPDLAVRKDGAGFRITGRFPTELHPNGSAPAPTGRVYDLRITVAPSRGAARDGWRPARGVLELGPGRTTTVDEPGLNLPRAPS